MEVDDVVGIAWWSEGAGPRDKFVPQGRRKQRVTRKRGGEVDAHRMRSTWSSSFSPRSSNASRNMSGRRSRLGPCTAIARESAMQSSVETNTENREEEAHLVEPLEKRSSAREAGVA